MHGTGPQNKGPWLQHCHSQETALGTRIARCRSPEIAERGHHFTWRWKIIQPQETHKAFCRELATGPLEAGTAAHRAAGGRVSALPAPRWGEVRLVSRRCGPASRCDPHRSLTRPPPWLADPFPGPWRPPTERCQDLHSLVLGLKRRMGRLILRHGWFFIRGRHTFMLYELLKRQGLSETEDSLL